MFEKFKFKNLADYHDLYIQRDALLLADVFENFRSKSFEIYELNPTHVLPPPGLAWQACLEKTKVELELLTEKVIRGGICHTIQRYAKANNKYMKNYGKNIGSSYLMYADANNFYGWAMSVNGFKWVKKISKFDERSIKCYDGNSNKGNFLEVDVEYLKTLFDLYSDLPFLSERNKIEKCNKLVCNIHDKKNYVVHIRALKQALNLGLIFKKVHKIIQFNQEEWLKPYIDTNTKLRTEAKNDFEKDFFKLMNNAAFGKTVENVRKHRDIKLVATDKRRNKLASKPNYHTAKYFSENLIAIKMKKTKVKMNKPIYLDMPILDIISKTLMYGFWYYYIRPKYQHRANLSYMDTDSFIIHIKIEDFYKDTANEDDAMKMIKYRIR